MLVVSDRQQKKQQNCRHPSKVPVRPSMRAPAASACPVSAAVAAAQPLLLAVLGAAAFCLMPVVHQQPLPTANPSTPIWWQSPCNNYAMGPACGGGCAGGAAAQAPWLPPSGPKCCCSSSSSCRATEVHADEGTTITITPGDGNLSSLLNSSPWLVADGGGNCQSKNYTIRCTTNSTYWSPRLVFETVEYSSVPIADDKCLSNFNTRIGSYAGTFYQYPVGRNNNTDLQVAELDGVKLDSDSGKFIYPYVMSGPLIQSVRCQKEPSQYSNPCPCMDEVGLNTTLGVNVSLGVYSTKLDANRCPVFTVFCVQEKPNATMLVVTVEDGSYAVNSTTDDGLAVIQKGLACDPLSRMLYIRERGAAPRHVRKQFQDESPIDWIGCMQSDFSSDNQPEPSSSASPSPPTEVPSSTLGP